MANGAEGNRYQKAQEDYRQKSGQRKDDGDLQTTLPVALCPGNIGQDDWTAKKKAGSPAHKKTSH